MKVDGSNNAATLTGTSSPSSSARGTKTALRGRADNAALDSVTLSSASSQIKALESGITEASGFDAAKVEKIKQAISEGRFTIKPELIADKLIASAKELATQRRN